jgi:hypothetical protein
VLLLITGSEDGTSNLLVSRFEGRVFRLNFDLFADYKLAFTPDGWEIENPAGLRITSDTVSKCFWWKSFSYFIQQQDPFVVEEVKYVCRELYHWCRLRGLTVGNPPDFHNHLGKINLLQIAARHFPTPPTLVSFGLHGVAALAAERVVAKSLTSGLTATNRALFTTEVDRRALHPGFPWFLQELLDSPADVTVFVAGEALFAFRRLRQDLVGLDWRKEQDFDSIDDGWEKIALSASEEAATRGFMAAIGANWGRLDFMRVGEALVFLEYNANGQWVFLDFDDKHGLLDAVVRYLS